MALRDFVTGSDACTPGDGAGPSNAAGALANTLLGRASKQQERLREVGSLMSRMHVSQHVGPQNSLNAVSHACVVQLPGVHGPSGPGPSVYAAPRAPTVADIARAAAEGPPPSSVFVNRSPLQSVNAAHNGRLVQLSVTSVGIWCWRAARCLHPAALFCGAGKGIRNRAWHGGATCAPAVRGTCRGHGRHPGAGGSQRRQPGRCRRLLARPAPEAPVIDAAALPAGAGVAAPRGRRPRGIRGGVPGGAAPAADAVPARRDSRRPQRAAAVPPGDDPLRRHSRACTSRLTLRSGCSLSQPCISDPAALPPLRCAAHTNTYS